MRLLRTIGGIDFTGQERAALNKLTMPAPCTNASQDWRAQLGSAPQGPYRVSRGFRVRAADDAADRVGLDP